VKALCFDRFGSPDVLACRELPDPRPGPGEALVRTRALGLNFADVWRRHQLAARVVFAAPDRGAGARRALTGRDGRRRRLPLRARSRAPRLAARR
jgi:NADPH:quinone reductase-like Zn-dependent oxidoreductase